MEPLSDPASIPQVHVYLAIQNRLLREALVRLFRKRADLLVVGQSAPAHTEAAAVLESKCEILLLDSLHSGFVGEESVALEPLLDAFKIVLIGMDAEEKQFIAAVRAGIMGYLLKDASTSDVIAGRTYRLARRSGLSFPALRRAFPFHRPRAGKPRRPAQPEAGSYPAPAATGRARGEGLDQQGDRISLEPLRIHRSQPYPQDLKASGRRNPKPGGGAIRSYGYSITA
jgi:hypothetical protein